MSPPFTDFTLPPDKEALLRRAGRLAWASVGFQLSILAVVGLVASGSQTMKAMWVEDAASLIPSLGFLVGVHFRRKPPDDRFPYGYRRAVLVAYLAGSLALLGLGLWIFGDSAYKLLAAEHPTIPTVGLLGRRVWLGWLMVAALTYSCVPPFVLGRMKVPLSRELSDKALHTSATLDKGDWLSGLAGVLGILGIAWGYWWADGLAAGLISADIVKDGFNSLRNSVAQVMNGRPTDVESKQKDPVVDRVQRAVEGLGWVAEARVRLREEGDALTGEVFLVPRDESGLLGKLQEARGRVQAVDWRLYDVLIVPVPSVA